MKIPFISKPTLEMTLQDLEKYKFKDVGIGTNEGQIHARGDYRVLYNATNDRVIRAYQISETKVKPLSLTQLDEILHYIESHHNKQENTGSE